MNLTNNIGRIIPCFRGIDNVPNRNWGWLIMGMNCLTHDLGRTVEVPISERVSQRMNIVLWGIFMTGSVWSYLVTQKHTFLQKIYWVLHRKQWASHGFWRTLQFIQWDFSAKARPDVGFSHMRYQKALVQNNIKAVGLGFFFDEWIRWMLSCNESR